MVFVINSILSRTLHLLDHFRQPLTTSLPFILSLPNCFSLCSLSFRHLQNFVLLFASNVENLLAYMLSSHTIVNEHVVKIMENVLAIVYLYLVVKNLIWFIKPLKDRDDFMHIQIWFDSIIDSMKASLNWNKAKEGGSENIGRSGHEVATTSSTRGTVRMKNSEHKND